MFFKKDKFVLLRNQSLSSVLHAIFSCQISKVMPLHTIQKLWTNFDSVNKGKDREYARFHLKDYIKSCLIYFKLV